MRFGTNLKTIHLITSAWTLFYFGYLIVNFLKGNEYEFLASAFSALYVGVLTMYVGSKEFDRWYSTHESRRNGELFVAAFTIAIMVLIFGALVLGPHYRVSPDVVATYIATMSLFVLTQKSKTLRNKRKK
jgi:hypothetical protein